MSQQPAVSTSDLLKIIAEQKAMLEALKEQMNKPKALTMKVTAPRLNEKTGKMEGSTGALSIYGLSRFPITMYRSQWERLFAAREQVEAFIKANDTLLAVKS